ncbi:MAG: hypothetical protein L6W00_17290 [Lentisphaeria bacterium]|nr:MAG: hypothetical protein L6W00_17290 [Lentisphaeria bacterium]
MQHSEPNFTAGKIPVQLFHFSVPLFFANVLQAAYHLVDMMVIGHFVGSSGLAAVGNASMLCFIINSIGIGITLGGTVEVARAHGRGDSVAERNAVGTLFAVTAAAALPVTVCGLWFSREIFLRMDIPPEALPSACEYMYILSCGTLCSFGGNAVCALLRGLGIPAGRCCSSRWLRRSTSCWICCWSEYGVLEFPERPGRRWRRRPPPC